MFDSKKEKGFIPLIILIAIGAIIFGAGAYLVRQQLSKTKKESRTTIGEEKIKRQIETKTSLPAPTPVPKVELSKEQFSYQPEKQESVGSQNVNPPGFTINPPTGYTQQTNPAYKVIFFSPEKDKERVANVGDYKLPARVLVNMLSLESLPGFSELEKKANFSEGKMLELIDETTIIDVKSSVILKDEPTKLAGQECRILEYKASSLVGGKFEVWEHVYSYMFIKNKHLVVISGGSLESAWTKRAPEIIASLNTFTFSD